MSAIDFNANIVIFCTLSNLSYILFERYYVLHIIEYMNLCFTQKFLIMDSKKLKKRKRQADKPMRIFEELNRPVTYILDDVKETIVTENTYKAIPYNVLKTYFLPKVMF